MKLYKIILLFLVIPLIGFSSFSKKHKKSKTISKKFDVNTNATLYINNKYGNIDVVTWSENRVEIDVKITVKGSNLTRVEDKLDNISVDFEDSKNLVEARTRIEKTSSKWSSWWRSNNNLSFKIHYTVKMPATNNVDFHNSYGNIYISTPVKGKTTINCSYGNIEVDKLLNSANFIELDYCGSSDIEYMKNGEVNLDYSKITIDKTEKTKINADYATVKIGKATTVTFNADYGGITINEVNEITGNADYTSVRIGTVYKNLTIDTDYGGLRIKNIAKGFENINIKNSYAGIRIGTSVDNNFSFDINLGYASFKYPKEYIDIQKSIKKTSKKSYSGVFGKDNGLSKIKIRSSYGSVTLQTTN